MLLFWTFYSSKKPEKNLLSFFQHNNKKKNFFWAANQNIRMISEGSCDWSNDAKKISFEITGINYILKYIQIENSYFK